MTRFLRRLWTFVRPYKSRLLLGLVCGTLFALCNVLLVVVVRVVINMVFGQETMTLEGEAEKARGILKPILTFLASHVPRFDRPASEGGLLLMLGLIPCVMLARTLFNYLNIYLVNWASTRAIADLRTSVFGHLQSLPISFFNQSNTGELISRVTNDTQTLRQIISHSVASLISDPLTIVFLLTLLFSWQPVLTLFAVVVLPICILPITIYGRRVRRSARAMQGHAADLAKVMHESFTGTRVIKAYNMEETMVGQFREITKKAVSHTMRVVRANELPGSIIEFLGAVGTSLILLLLVLHRFGVEVPGMSSENQNAGDFVALIGAVFMMYKPIKSLARLHNQLLAAQAASSRVFELLDTRSTLPDPVSPKPLQAAGADIHFENVHFSYAEKPVLQDIQLTVKAGQLVALVGSSGSGKTTLVNLLPRFYDPERGAVRIGGTDIRDVAVKELRRQIALVTQETILFHDTIRRNIAVGRPEATMAEIEAAARHAYAHEFIMEKPGGYESVVGEKGVTLSGGQRQRIAIARALVKNAPILILDEATSALDTESERAVQTALERLMRGRTTICIAHRLSTIQNADVIVVMDEGSIVEMGSHEELLQRNGVYQKLYELQFQK